MIRLGLIGCGYWGKKLLRVFSNIPEVEILFVCDKQSKNEQWVSEHCLKSKFITDYSEIIDSPCDAVVIATPAESHYEITEAFLKAGKHVFVEKPLALSTQKAQQLVSLAEASNLQLLVGQVFEYDPAIDAIQTILKSGDLGEIFYIDSIRNNSGFLRKDVNVIWDLVIHDISILYRITGKLPYRVSAIGGCYLTKGSENVCEKCQINIMMPQNTLASIQASWLEPIKMRQLRVIGSQKSLVFDPNYDHKIHIYNQKTQINSTEITNEINDCTNNYSQVTYSAVEPLQVEAETFIGNILSGEAGNSLNAIKFISVIENIQTSLDKDGEWILVE